MPYFPNPIVDPAGEIGRFIGAYMRKHVIVDHDGITQGVLIAALQAHKTLKPSATRSAARAASLALLEQALERLDPQSLVLVRQYQDDKALKAFLAARVELKQRQGQAVQDYEAAYQSLSKEFQDVFATLAPPPAAERVAACDQPHPGQPAAGHSPEELGARSEGDSPERRLALVIGNGAYQEVPLLNPLNDARAMEQSLRAAGFDVLKHENLAKRALEDEIRAFGKRLRAGGVGLFYFAGHGVQVNGYNYLVPIGSTIDKEQDVEYEAVEAGRVISKMEAAGNRLNIMILDACRNNPFTRSWRAGTRGLAPMNAPRGTLIAYATAPGTVSSDGDGAHGLYTHALLQQIQVPGLKLEDVFKRVRVAVKATSHGKQLPWESSSLEGDFYFMPGGPR